MCLKLRSDLEDEFSCMEEKLNFFLQYDMVYINKVSFYVELSDIGHATEKAVGEAMSKSGEFLGSLTDVNGIFHSSKAACLRLAADIMAFVDGSTNIGPTEVLKLGELRETLRNKVARSKGSWENLIRYAVDYDESTVFHEISELVWTTEETTREALFGSDRLPTLVAGSAMIATLRRIFPSQELR
jgi:hypothetical protein